MTATLATPPIETGSTPERRPRTAMYVVAAVVAVGVLLRCSTRSALWLDESITVSIARLPLSQLQQALKVDGAPPLYYVLLHAWLHVFGPSPLAARSLSGLFAIGTLPLAWLAGRREAGPAGGRAAVLLLASSPFAVYYATEARMYSLVLLLVTGGYLLLRRALDEPTLARLAPLPVIAAALAYTHYWSLFLLVVVVAVLLVAGWRRTANRRSALRCAVAIALGGVLFLPWLPTFLFQAAHTGTPWAQPAQYSAIAAAVSEWAGGSSNPGRVLALIFLFLAAAGLLGRRLDARQMVVDLSPSSASAALATVFLGTLVLALTAGLISGSGFAGRYTMVVFLPFLLLLVRGLAALPAAATRPVLTLAVAAGLATSVVNPFRADKTDADLVAATIRAGYAPGDVVAYCPDQLGPAVSRLLSSSIPQLTYPTGGLPARVDWVDYAQRNAASRPSDFAALVAARHPRTIWYVESTEYRTFEGKCDQLAVLLGKGHRRRVLVASNHTYYEHPALVRYDAGAR